MAPQSLISWLSKNVSVTAHSGTFPPVVTTAILRTVGKQKRLLKRHPL
jgi:hypothetical protein